MSVSSGRFFTNGRAGAAAEREPGAFRRWRRWLIWLVLLLALAGHVVFHYLPRERPGSPRPGDLPAQLLEHGEYEARLWIAYPHQNLGTLAAALENPDAYLAAASRAAEVPPPVLHSFGPFPAPPARELTLATDLEGERFAAVARVYPLLSGLARLAGWVAGNPWLSGGEARVGERAVRVRWEGSLWIVEPLEEPLELKRDDAEREEAGAASLARIALRRKVGVLPPGAYRFQRTAEGLALLGESTSGADLASGLRTALVRASADIGGLSVVVLDTGLDSGSPRAAALYGDRVDKLPRAAVLSRPGFDRWRLPGEEFLSLVGKELPQAEVAGWHILTYDRATLRAARALPPVVEAAASQGLAYGLWLRPRAARGTVDSVADLLDSIPLLGRRHARRWQDWSVLLGPFDRFAAVVVEIGTGPGEARVLFLDPSGNTLSD